MNNWINDLYQATPYELSSLAVTHDEGQSPRRLVT
jgi:homoserine trans-succinylase